MPTLTELEQQTKDTCDDILAKYKERKRSFNKLIVDFVPVDFEIECEICRYCDLAGNEVVVNSETCDIVYLQRYYNEEDWI